MSTPAIISTAPETTPEPSTQPETCAAVQRCLEAFNRIYLPLIAKGNYEPIACREAGPAYRAAMPQLTSPSNVRDFIACTAHGLLVGAIDEKQASRLLYAAQVASGAFNRQAKDTKPKPTSKIAH
jgi:hypothetical protein